MDGIDEYIWQRRIHHGVRYQRSAVPFPESVELGLEFNAALDRKDKLDLCLLTNGVMLELCDFAKTVTKSEKYFMFEMMEFNFDLGVDADSEQQCYDYATRAHNKIKMLKEQIKMKPRRLKEAFLLPDVSVITASSGAEQPGRYYPKRNKMADSSVLTGSGQSSQSERSGAALIIKKRGGAQLKLTADAYPFCKELGVRLVVRPGDAPTPKQDPSLITNGVMLELLDFSRVLCGTHTAIVHDLVKLNFGYEVDKALFRTQVTKLMERKCACLTTEDRDAFRKEAFRGQTHKRELKARKRKEPDAGHHEMEVASKRRETPRHQDTEDNDISQDAEDNDISQDSEDNDISHDAEDNDISHDAEDNDISHDAEDNDISQDAEDNDISQDAEDNDISQDAEDNDISQDAEDNDISQDAEENDISHDAEDNDISQDAEDNDISHDAEDNDISQDSELSYMCPLDCETEMLSDSEDGPEPTTIDGSERRDVKEEEEDVLVSPGQLQFMDHSGGRPSALKEVSTLFSEDQTEDVGVRTWKQKLWMRRSARSKQILTSSRVNDLFARCRERGIDFNVASTHKQTLDLQLLTNSVMWEVYKFASAMTKSLRSFLFEILNNNFNLVLHDELHERNFIFYMITKEKSVQVHPERHSEDFLIRPFHFPEVYNMVDVTGDFHTGQEVEVEQQTDGDPPASASSQEADLDPHPFCKKLGLNLWALEERLASNKLDLTVLTTGAVLEVFAFVRELCGSVRETVNDILEHNFDVDLQSGATEASQVIQRWYGTQKSLMRRQTASPKVSRWLNMVVPLSGPSQLHPPPPAANEPEDHLVPEEAEPEVETVSGGVGTKETEDTEEAKETEVNSYRICEGIGLELDVLSKREARSKLDPQLLTRGVLFEMHRYVEQNCNRYVPALYEILEYNFDLSSQSHRKVEFAWSVAAQVIAIAGKTGRKGDYMNQVVELPIQVQVSESSRVKEEPEDCFTELDLNDNDDVVFVHELKPVDIEVEIE